MTVIRSRIKQFINDKLMDDLYKVCMRRSISDNNKKVRMIEESLTAHGVEYVMLGPGTNRVAVLIDNYVFKIAMDDWGIRDNKNEFMNSTELQPFVVKTYETNGLLSVCEYVTLITREEFEENREVIIGILSILADSYLLGDVGYAPKNFTNWGYRDDGQLVILDFAYVYQISNDIILCAKDGQILEYNPNFTQLVCPRCHQKYEFMDLRRRIPKEYEEEMNQVDLRDAYALTTPKIYIDDDDEENLEEHRVTRNDVLGTREQQQKDKLDEGTESNMSFYEEEEEKNGMSGYEKLNSIISQAKHNPLSFVPESNTVEDNPPQEEIETEEEDEYSYLELDSDDDECDEVEDEEALMDQASSLSKALVTITTNNRQDIELDVEEEVEAPCEGESLFKPEVPDTESEAVAQAAKQADALIVEDAVTPEGEIVVPHPDDEDDLMSRAFEHLEVDEEEVVVDEDPCDKPSKRRDWTI